MKRWLWYLLTFAVVIVLGLLAFGSFSPGYVLVYIGGYSFETSVVALLLAVVALMLLFKFVWWLLRTLNPLRLRNLRLLRRFIAPRDPVLASNQGVQELLLGNWQQAYRLLVESADKVQNPAFNYLAASLAAFQRGDQGNWSYCLDQAEKATPTLANGVRSLRAQLTAQSGDRKQALTMLHELQRSKPNQPWVLQQMADIYRAVGDWTSLEQMLPDLERYHAFSSGNLHALQDEVYQHQLQMAGNHGEASLKRYWNTVPKALRSHARITGAYIQQLLTVGNDGEAAALLEAFLKKQWSDDIVALVGQVNSGNPQQQLALLEGCLRQHPDNPVLLLTLGRVCLRHQLWGKARDYFEKGLGVATTAVHKARLSTELAKLYDQLGERDKAAQYHQQAVRLLEKVG